ncbi:FMN-dependent NADH-azoreductase [Actinomadura macrotermitis]|uniref:FMN dependent NADH:quinone oxidoreductase n=1 Tax=Actinomadura macrotermitis TaxID=2585200 RepID=A0A7K0BZV5_9ACTN|nr:NAD(P)H-dependent oxidoreductase [Actinomadura macrotermitis]MQY06717.1 FMN-dependent NADH-azoreductase [Actinomadura macrotermitis]
MNTLLHLDASARRRSVSREVGTAFAEAWRAVHPGGTYLYRDLAAAPVPFIDEAWTELCDNVLRTGVTDLDRLHEAARPPGQKAAWATLEPLFNELVAADVVLIATPMYNFGIPASLKAWIDQVTFPKMSLAGRRFVVASARGGSYAPGAPRAPYDYQERYLRDFIAGHFAVEDVTFINAELVNSRIDPNLAHLRAAHDDSYAAALHTAATLAKEY